MKAITFVLTSDISWRCTNRPCKARLRTDSAMSTMIPSGTGLVEKNTDFGLQSKLQGHGNEMRKLLTHSFGFHFLCPSDVEMWAEKNK